MVPGQSADVSETVEDSEHRKSKTWDPQQAGSLDADTHVDSYHGNTREAVTMDTMGERELWCYQGNRIMKKTDKLLLWIQINNYFNRDRKHTYYYHGDKDRLSPWKRADNLLP